MRKLLCLFLALALLAVPVYGTEYEAKSWILMDAATGTVLESGNEHEKLAPASVTKVMTLLLIMEAIDSGQLGWDDPVTASETAAAKGGSRVFLKGGRPGAWRTWSNPSPSPPPTTAPAPWRSTCAAPRQLSWSG